MIDIATWDLMLLYLAEQNIPHRGLREDGTIWPAQATTPEQEAQANAILAAWPSGVESWLAEHGGNAPLTLRREAKERLDAAHHEVALLRAVIALTVSELNLLRQWISDFKAATAAATSLANLQTRVAALPNVPQRTTEQVRTAIKQKVTDGEADS